MESTPKPFDHFWRCVECGNSVKHFLGMCWKCGIARPGGEVARQASLESEREILTQPWSVRENAVKGWPREFVDRYKRDIERHLRRIDLARSIVLSTTSHVAGLRLVSRLETIVVTGQECRSAVALGEYYQEGYHGELHHADYGELVVFLLMYKAHQLGANAVWWCHPGFDAGSRQSTTLGRTEMKLLNVIGLVVVLGNAISARGDEPKEKSAELQVLDRYVGTWDETLVVKPALWTPERATATTTTTRRWILNGQMIENKGAWKPGNSEFLHLMTFDPKQKEYRQWYFDSDNLVPQAYQGKWDAAIQTFTFTGTLADGTQSTGQQHFVGKDTFTWTLVAKDRTGKVVLDMEGKCVRKK